MSPSLDWLVRGLPYQLDQILGSRPALLGDKELGFRFRLLEALSNHLLKDRQIRRIRVNEVESEAPIYYGQRAPDTGRIDVFAKGIWEEEGKDTPWLLVVEAKIDAKEGEDQLSKYDAWLRLDYPAWEIVSVFLTPDGREPRSKSGNWQSCRLLS
jgi:hypothetical protein